MKINWNWNCSSFAKVEKDPCALIENAMCHISHIVVVQHAEYSSEYIKAKAGYVSSQGNRNPCSVYASFLASNDGDRMRHTFVGELVS